MDLQNIRSTIDQIDDQLLRLLHRRMEYALRARKQKVQLTDPQREEQVFRNVIDRATGLLEYSFVSSLFESIIEQSKQVQQKGLKLVAFQGEHGAWGEIASRSLGPDMVPVPCKEFVDVFDGVVAKEFDFGVVPVENSIEGGVNEVNDLLIETDVRIAGEIRLPIHQNLLVIPGSDYRELKLVYSHPQALAQCRAFIRRTKLDPRPFYDTAGAARWLAQERPQASAAIASSLAAKLYGLEVVKENIEDHPQNMTRFVVIVHRDSQQTGDKCTIVFSTAHRSGSLYNVLKTFAENLINLTRIESRPVRQQPGTFAFLVDFLGDEGGENVRNALRLLELQAENLKVLGFYPEASQ
ncbi:MAG: prephenate dehydratase [Bacteroidetes bacterium]|nr:prephenate dehydratase [Bacteroidota bacterium]